MVVAEKYRKLFESAMIGNMWLKNRLVMAPMGILGLVENDGLLSQRAIDYYEERARGGIGLIITSAAFACTKFDPFWIDEVYRIGDCVKPSKIIDAVWEAYRKARII